MQPQSIDSSVHFYGCTYQSQCLVAITFNAHGRISSQQAFVPDHLTLNSEESEKQICLIRYSPLRICLYHNFRLLNADILQVYRHSSMAVPAKRHRDNEIVMLYAKGILGANADKTKYSGDFVRVQ